MVKRKIPEIISEEELVRVLQATKQDSHKVAFILGFYQGMRVSEIVGLKKATSRCCDAEISKTKTTWTDVLGRNRKKTLYACSKCGKEWKQCEARRNSPEWHIRPLMQENVDFDRKIITIRQAKGEKDRAIPIMVPNPIKNLLAQQTVVRALGKLPVKCSIRCLEHSLKQKCKKVLGKNVKFHGLRHSCGSWLINDLKWNTRQVQQFLGHSKVDITEIYTQVTSQNLVDLVWGQK